MVFSTTLRSILKCLFSFHLFTSDGQAIAIKLSKQINKVTDNMTKTIACHNAIHGADRLSFDVAKDPSSSVYANLQSSQLTTHVVPSATRRTVIELHCLKERCEEEIALLTSKMDHLISFFQKEINLLNTAIVNRVFGETSKWTIGLNSLLLSKKAEYVKNLHNLKRLWGQLIADSSEKR